MYQNGININEEPLYYEGNFKRRSYKNHVIKENTCKMTDMETELEYCRKGIFRDVYIF